MKMRRYADLEMAFRKRDERSYALAFRFNGPDDEAEQRAEPDPIVMFNAFELAGDDTEEYAAKLTATLFTADVRGIFGRFRTAAQQQSSILRVRLSIESSAPELHGLRWEKLRDPDVPDVPLFMGEQTVMSRFLSSGRDWRPIRLRPKSDLTALVVIANPVRAGKYGLAPVDVKAELDLAMQAMAGIQVEALAPGGAVSMNDIGSRLKKGFDVLYFVCHGLLVDEEPYLCMDEERPVPGIDLIQCLSQLDQRPRLVVMASCQSAGKGGVGLAALGPRLAEAGVPAVVAMQGNILMKTAAAFMKRFFTELLVDGQIDRAMSVARGEVLHFDDYWMPVLFMRLRNGRIWYEPGFDSSKGEFEQWDSICQFVRRGDCVPIIGPDVSEHVFGNSRTLAADLAQSLNFPLDSHERFDLAKVAQYIMTQHSVEFAQTKVIDAIFTQLDKCGERLLNRPLEDVPDLLDAIADHLMKASDPKEVDPLKIVAGLNAKVFVNAACDSLLELFVSRTMINGSPKQPVPLVSEWRDEALDYRNEIELLADASVERPYIYYLFGKMQRESTWVLTEDDFFDYVIRTTRYQLMPLVVSDALVTGSLLFLGFSLDDWKFRAMFRLILAKGGKKLLEGYNHVGVQLDPGETSIANARRAKKYLERYFLNSKIDIYWGTAADFLRELKRNLDIAPVPVARRRI